MNINLSSAQYDVVGKSLYSFYSNQALKQLAPNYYGCPHDGGEHTLQISGTKGECLAFVELFIETYPSTKPFLIPFLKHIKSTEKNSYRFRDFNNSLLTRRRKVIVRAIIKEALKKRCSIDVIDGIVKKLENSISYFEIFKAVNKCYGSDMVCLRALGLGTIMLDRDLEIEDYTKNHATIMWLHRAKLLSEAYKIKYKR